MTLQWRASNSYTFPDLVAKSFPLVCASLGSLIICHAKLYHQELKSIRLLYPNPNCFTSGARVRGEAHVIKKLVFIFARAVKRGHRPREAGIRELMQVAGIEVPDLSPRSIPSSTTLASILSQICFPFVLVLCWKHYCNLPRHIYTHAKNDTE